MSSISESREGCSKTRTTHPKAILFRLGQIKIDLPFLFKIRRMTKTPPPATPERNRLRAAAALIPIIESGLIDGKLATDRAIQMAHFCQWAMNSETTEQDAVALKEIIRSGLLRLDDRLQIQGKSTVDA